MPEEKPIPVVIFDEKLSWILAIETNLRKKYPDLKICTAQKIKEYKNIISSLKPPFIIFLGHGINCSEAYKRLPTGTFTIAYLYFPNQPEQKQPLLNKPLFYLRRNNENEKEINKALKWLKSQNCPIQTS